MRTSCKVLLAVVAAALAAGPALAQFQFFPGGMGGSAQLLMNKSVQEELKLTKEQTERVGKFQQETTQKMLEAFKQKDREKIQEASKQLAQDAEKLIKDVLKPEQAKRFKQIEMQQAGIRNFVNEETQKALKLTDEQKDKIRTISEDVRKDSAEIMKDAGFDREKRAEAQKKVASLNKEAMEKVNAVLNADQKKAFKEMLGEPFEIKMERPNFPLPGGGKPPADKADPVKRDF